MSYHTSSRRTETINHDKENTHIYTQTYIYMNGELFITVDYMRSQVTWHTCLHAELMHLKINTKIWNMPCHAFVVSPRWTIVNRGRCSHPIVITFPCWMCRWKGCISFIFRIRIVSTELGVNGMSNKSILQCRKNIWLCCTYIENCINVPCFITYSNSYLCYQLHVCIGKMLWARTIENTKEESRFYTFYD